MGVDMASQDDLIAANCTVEEICAHIGADSLAYLSLAGMMKALRTEDAQSDGVGYCNACFTGKYPFDDQTVALQIGRKQRFAEVLGE